MRGRTSRSHQNAVANDQLSDVTGNEINIPKQLHFTGHFLAGTKTKQSCSQQVPKKDAGINSSPQKVPRRLQNIRLSSQFSKTLYSEVGLTVQWRQVPPLSPHAIGRAQLLDSSSCSRILKKQQVMVSCLGPCPSGKPRRSS